MSFLQNGDRGEEFLFGPYRLIPSKRLLLIGDRSVGLGSRAFDMLELLVRRHGQVVSAREILERVWPDVIVEDANLRTQLSHLRAALGQEAGQSTYITNIRGRGYSFVAPVEYLVTPPPTRANTTPSTTWSLPGRLQRLVGRGNCLDSLPGLLKTRRFVTIVGPGGIGKTTLAIELGHLMAGEFASDVCYVDLGAIKSADLVISTVATALGYSVRSDDPLVGLASIVADRHVLLILDRCEHVIETVSTLAAELFLRTPQVHIIATSREPLRAEGEIVHLLDPLGLASEAPDLTACEALTVPSVQLFMQRAASSGYIAELQNCDAPKVARICRQLDGNPLALELAGSRLITYGFTELLAALGGRAILGWPGRRTELRHRTLEATLDWSFQLLPGIERRVLSRLSIFAGSFTMQAAQAVAKDDADDPWMVAKAVESLVDKSLVAIRVSGGSHSFRLLDVTRFYAELKLAESGESAAVARRHTLFCTDDLQRREPPPGTEPTSGRRSYGPLTGDIRAALEWCFSPMGEPDLGIILAAQASRMFLDLSMLDECQRWCRAALARLAEADRVSPRGLKLREALALSMMYASGNDESVGDAIRGALDTAVALGERQSQLHLLAGLNLYLTRREDFVGALEAAERFSAMAKASRDGVEIVAAEWMLGATQHLIGHQRLGQEILEQGFANARALGIRKIHYFGFDHGRRAVVTRTWTAWLRGMPDSAIRYASEALDVSIEPMHPVTLCMTYLYVTRVILWLRDLDWAETLIGALGDLATRHRLNPYLTGAQALQGELLLARGQTEAGLDLLRETLDPLRDEQQTIVLTTTLRAYAEGLARTGRIDEATETIAALVARAEHGAPTYMLPELLRTQADIMLAGGRDHDDRAEACYRKAVACAQRDEALGWELCATLSLARFWIERGRTAEARAELERILSRFTEGGQTADVLEAARLLQACTVTACSSLRRVAGRP